MKPVIKLTCCLLVIPIVIAIIITIVGMIIGKPEILGYAGLIASIILISGYLFKEGK